MPNDSNSPPRVAILMAVMDGAQFLTAQLDSIAAQTGVELVLLLSDDGSADGSGTCVAEWARANPRIDVRWQAGPGAGFAENFRRLIRDAPQADYYAFSDQDDIWLPDKLATAISRLAALRGPAVYGGRTRLVNETGQELGSSPLFGKPPGFGNALVQSLFGGNTIVLNGEGMALLREASARTGFVSHDWWAYIVVSGAGGRVIYDPAPHVLYRQHGNNLVGANIGRRARRQRLGRLLRGQLRNWTALNLVGLDAISDLLTPEARRQVEALRRMHEGALVTRLAAMRSGGFYRQTLAGTASLWVAAMLRRV